MDPLSVNMVLRSPPALKSKMSFANLVGRKKKTPAKEKSSLSKTPQTPKTPVKQTKIDGDSESTPSRSSTVRVRRGFRPLSVLTNSMLIPFEFDALKAMEEVGDGEIGRPTRQTTEGGGDETESTTTITINNSRLESLPLSNESEISLRAFLEQSAPPAFDVKDEIKAPFSTLHHLSAPDISHHPAYASNPFASRSDTPSLATTSSPSEIKDFAIQARNSPSHRTNRTSASSDVFGSIERKKFVFFNKLQSPTSSPLDRKTTNSTDLSPLVQRQARFHPIEIPYTPNIVENDSERKRIASGGLRKLSDIFKSRVASEKSNSPMTPPLSASPKATIEEMERYLRRVTCSPTFPYKDTSWYPRHPNTGRFWRSRNLKCTNCVDVCCACCGRTCCAYKAAVAALELTHKDNADGRDEAVEKMQKITMVFPYGREMPTFLTCTSSVGNGAGCGKQICPDCCGACPDESCGDIQCRRCKRDPWAVCDWHANMSLAASSSVDATSIRHTV